MKRFAGAVITAVLAGTLAACSTSASSQPQSAQSSLSLQASTPTTAGDCMLGANGVDVQVGIANPAAQCSQWLTNLAGDGLVWNYVSALVPPGQPGTADSETMGQTCDLTDGTQELYVQDAGGMTYGSSICSAEEQNGWTPETSPGPLALLMQHVGQAQAQASAQAAATASVQAAQQQAQANLSSDDQTLNGDTNSLSADITKYRADLKTAQGDYAQVSTEPLCSGGSPDQNTYDDAQNVYDDGQNVYDDEMSVSNDLSSLQSAYSQTQSDVSGAAIAGTQYATDMTNAQALIQPAQAIGTANASGTIQNEASAIQSKVDSAAC